MTRSETQRDYVIAVMDADCGLCAKGARWIAHNDRKDLFRIVPVQSPRGRVLMQERGLNSDDPSTWLIIDGDDSFSDLDALMAAGHRLGGVWRGLALLRIFPAPLRRWAYSVVARNRYRFFGRVDLCALPDPKIQRKLLQ
ncbi:MAG: DCC1-like thiol-disulfide oxidoreductase family protein [Pseudomonadota bacterium]